MNKFSNSKLIVCKRGLNRNLQALKQPKRNTLWRSAMAASRWRRRSSVYRPRQRGAAPGTCGSVLVPSLAEILVCTWNVKFDLWKKSVTYPISISKKKPVLSELIINMLEKRTENENKHLWLLENRWSIWKTMYMTPCFLIDLVEHLQLCFVSGCCTNCNRHEYVEFSYISPK